MNAQVAGVRSRTVKVLLAGALLVLAACTSSAQQKQITKGDLNDNPGTGTFQGAGLTPAQPRPAFTLKDTAGRTFSFGTQTAGHPTLLFYGYTHCDDECPDTMADVRIALKSVPKAVAAKTYVVFVTTDPKRDTGPVLATWLGRFDKGTGATWVGLTGTQAQIDTAQVAAHVMVAEDGGQTHSTQLLLYGPDDYAHVVFLVNNSEDKQIAHDLPRVAAGRT